MAVIQKLQTAVTFLFVNGGGGGRGGGGGSADCMI